MDSLKVLAVDDDPSVRLLLSEALQRRGCDVTVASDGVEAAKCLFDEPFDVLVTDLWMPRMDGARLAELAHRIRPGIGILVITGQPSESSVLDTFKHGAAAYLVKPIDLTELFRRIRDLKRQPENLAPSPPPKITSPRAGWIEFEAPSATVYLERFENLLEVLTGQGLPRESVEDIRLAVHELGANAIEWGNEEDARRPLRISAMMEPDQVVIVIEDQGEGFRPEAVPNPIEDPERVMRERKAAGKRPGGYGLAMAGALVDELFFNEAGNMVVMTKRVPPGSPVGDGATPGVEKPG